jgi:DNA helicase II / ATP-dependent DNA helicase PcrA
MNLSLEQKKIIDSEDKYVQVIAGAGSGKTFTMIRLTQKIYHSNKYNENEILLITFSRKAVGELQERLIHLVGNTNIQVYTFHAYCLKIIKKYHPNYRNGVSIISPEEKEKIVTEFFKQNKFIIGGIPYELLLSKNTNFIQKKFPNFFNEMNEYYNDYKKNNSKLDFEDLVLMFLNALKERKEWAISASNEVKLIIVDEFQDTDPLQLEWLKEMNPTRLVVVGDDWQAIYGFRGASSEPFLNFPKYFKGCKRYFLTTNHRSTLEIIKISSIPISKNKHNIKKKIQSQKTTNGLVKCIALENSENWIQLLPYLEKDDSIVLCRTNFRIHNLIKLGFPQKKIMTIHASKGLEFESVLIDLTAGWSNDSIEYIEEERRILYVGLSRAKTNLYIVGLNHKKDGLESEFFNYFNKKVRLKDILCSNSH